MDNTTNIIYNIKALDNATATINSVAASLRALKKISNVTIRIKTVYDTKNNITNTVKDVYKASASVNATVRRTLVDTYKTVETHQTNVINKNKTINDQVNRTKNVTKDVASGSKKVAEGFDKFEQRISSALKKLISIRKIFSLIRKASEESAEWIENLHLFEVAFDGATEDAYKFGKTMSDAFNTSINETTRYLSLFRQMTDAIGIADATATKMSKTLTALGYDIASLYNISIQSAMEKLEAGIAGQTKPLRTLGMDITAQSLDNYLKNELKLSNVTSKQMTQADKMILRTIVIMDQAQNAYGDMAETLNTFSNQMKVLQGSFENFKLALGDFIAKYFYNFISILGGIVIAATDIIRIFVPLTDTSGVESLTNSLVGVEDELEEIEETAGLLSFDKFNALTKNSNGVGAGNITSLLEEVLGTKYDEYMEQFQAGLTQVESKAKDIAEQIKSWVFPFANWDEETGELIGNLGEVNGVLKAIWHTLKLIVAIEIVSKLSKIPALLTKVCEGIVNGNAALKVMDGLLVSAGWVVLVKGLMDVIENWNKMSTAGKIASSIILGVVFVVNLLTTALYLHKIELGENIAIAWLYVKDAAVAMIASIKAQAVAIWSKLVVAFKGLATTISTTVFPTMLRLMATVDGLLVGISALAAGIAYYISNLDKMSTTAKILIPVIAALSAVFVGLAVAKAAAAAGIGAPVMAGITAAALTAGIVLAAGTAMSIGKFEDGGFPERGQLFIANEAGAELVGNIGGKTGVANNDMIVQAIENAAFRGFVRAIDATGQTGSASSSRPIILSINGRELARATAPDMAEEFGRRNIKIK